MPGVKNYNSIALYGKQDTVDVRLAPIEQMPHLKRSSGAFGCEGTAHGEIRKRSDGVSDPSNHCKPVGPACSEISQSKMP